MGTVKAFEDPVDLIRYVRYYLSFSPGQLKHLRHLDLDLDMIDYMFCFDVRVAPFKDTMESNPGRAAIFSELTNLKSLGLHFRSAIGAAEDSAWRYPGRSNGHEWCCDHRGAHDSQGFSTPCQKLLVDWILTTKWNRILADERAVHSSHNVRAEKQITETLADR
ncbi:hypothetical protein LTR36_008302 [Oleoguttula mirabilis]|uniref:Uncharacterized protein n=1 Tax=Oleoguttula mirabilis TaxID=1507867 RepID=A0AAV9J8J7_9PEZI|nr:hypothetical protein LTR36_008302 [Oleoguttula mirabilis]